MAADDDFRATSAQGDYRLVQKRLNDKNVYHIIDGQQRITACSLILCALYELLSEEDDELFDSNVRGPRNKQYLLQKQQLGAQYAVTQLFFDNQKYFDFVERARQMGITIPIIPGIKPLAKLSQLTVVPKTFHCDIPEPLAREIVKCKTDDDAKRLGVEWTTQQCHELYSRGINDIHFYTMGAVDSVVEIVERLKK